MSAIDEVAKGVTQEVVESHIIKNSLLWIQKHIKIVLMLSFVLITLIVGILFLSDDDDSSSVGESNQTTTNIESNDTAEDQSDLIEENE